MPNTAARLLRASLVCAGLTMAAGVMAQGGGWPGTGMPDLGKLKSDAAPAPTLKDIDALERALTDAWTAMPLTQRHALFVANRPTLYGGYEERSSSVFAPGEKLVTYVEPVGYTWTAVEGGYRFGITMDFAVKTRDGTILAGKDAFQAFTFTSHFRNREVFVNVTMALDGLNPGDYLLVYTLHDNGSAKASSFSQPFTIATKG